MAAFAMSDGVDHLLDVVEVAVFLDVFDEGVTAFVTVHARVFAGDWK